MADFTIRGNAPPALFVLLRGRFLTYHSCTLQRLVTLVCSLECSRSSVSRSLLFSRIETVLDLRILHQRDPLSLELDLELPRNHHQFMPREREEIEIRLGEQQRELEDAMIREAVELGANGLIEFLVEGPFPIEHGELAGRVSLMSLILFESERC